MSFPPLSPTWDPKAAGDRVLAGLRNICRPAVKGAHDSHLVIVGDHAFVIYMANEVQPGEAATWPFVYSALSIVRLSTGALEQTLTLAAGEQQYDNLRLPAGACFVPRVLRVDATTLRCYFASEAPGQRQSQTWYLDYDLRAGDCRWRLQQAVLRTDQGVFPMEPRWFHAHQAAKGFTHPPKDYGLYLIDGFKVIGGETLAVLNNWPGGNLGVGRLNAARDEFTVIGDFFEPTDAYLTESAINRLPDGSWLAATRQEKADRNVLFATSADGRRWAPHAPHPAIANGWNSKTLLECFNGVYYLGWQEATKINGVNRSVFNIEVSSDGRDWRRKYRFETERSFQYPSLAAAPDGAIYLSVTQGDDSPSHKERIVFGRLE